ncbi:MAG TPA: hypothetical protein PK236_04600, partial [Verrucomicrobiota bacterium]|nr:hypothetical protein [Verrucomicrobiota bacterium]
MFEQTSTSVLALDNRQRSNDAAGAFLFEVRLTDMPAPYQKRFSAFAVGACVRKSKTGVQKSKTRVRESKTRVRESKTR